MQVPRVMQADTISSSVMPVREEDDHKHRAYKEGDSGARQ